MMESPFAPSMGEPAARATAATTVALRRLAFAAALLLLVPGGEALRAAPVDPPYPSTSTLRSLQLTTFDCGRENSEAACAKARTTADGLLDHPRLPGRCKDVLWTIRQQATVAPANSLERREPIDAAAREVVVACRQLNRSAPKPETPAAAPRPGGFNFGTGAPPSP
jgi:hypothetical protein